MNKKLNRKDFIKGLMYLLLLPILYILNRTVKDHKRFGLATQELRLKNNIPIGLSISNEVVFYKANGDLKVYSARCTHLGCRINHIEDNEIVCPCHGSRYNTEGVPIKGPSVKKLKELDFEIEQDEIIINLNA